MIMDRKGSDDVFDKKKRKKEESKHHKHVRMSNDIRDSRNNRSTSHNRPGVHMDKYKQHDTSGPITVKNSKLPSAFDVNHKSKRSMKSIVKVDKKAHETSYYKNNKESHHVKPPKTSHGKNTRTSNEYPEHSPTNGEEERKGAKDDYKHGIKNKPKTLINKKLPDVFSNPQMKYKAMKNEQYIKQTGLKSDQSNIILAGRDDRRNKPKKNKKDASRVEDPRKSKQTTLDPMSISIEQKKSMKRKLHEVVSKGEPSSKYDAMGASKSNGFGSFSKISPDVQINSFSPSSVKLQHMVSLALVKSSNLSGPIKKMLHVPSFSIY